MFSVIQFDESDGGSVSIVLNKWLTPRRREVHWPPIKDGNSDQEKRSEDGKSFNRLLTQNIDNSPDDSWKLYGVKRIFAETDDLEKAKKKLKLSEVTSDLQTDAETETERPKRRAVRTKRYISSDDDDNPPPLKKHFAKRIENEQSVTVSPPILHQRVDETRNDDLNLSDSSDSVIQNTPRRDSSPSLRSEVNKNTAKRVPVLKSCAVSSNIKSYTALASRSHPRFDDEIRNEDAFNLNEFELDSVIQNTPKRVFASPSCAFGSHTKKNTGFEEKVLGVLASIKAQNEQIISLLKKETTQDAAPPLKPNIKFPLETSEDISEIETYLQDEDNSKLLIRYLSSLGGRDVATKVYRVLKHIMIDWLASQYNFYGKRSTKKPFCNMKLKSVIIESIKWSSPGSNNKDIEDCIKVWLKHAPERLKRHSNK